MKKNFVLKFLEENLKFVVKRKGGFYSLRSKKLHIEVHFLKNNVIFQQVTCKSDDNKCIGFYLTWYNLDKDKFIKSNEKFLI